MTARAMARPEGPGVRTQARLAQRLLAVAFLAGAVISAPSGFGLLWFVPYAGVGTVLAVRRPRSPIGWILLALGWAFVLVTLPVNATAEQFATGTVDPITAVGGILSATMGAAGFYLLAVLAIVFPSGRLPTGRWHRVAFAGIAVGLVCVVAQAFAPLISVSLWGSSTSGKVRNPAAFLPDLPIWQVANPDTLILPVVALMISAAISLVVRYQGARGVERQQLRWLTAALAFVVVAVLTGFVIGQLIPAAAESGVVWLGAVVAFPCIPVAIGIAVMRYRLYEIDRIISRTIGWVVVTAILAAVFAIVIVGLQAVLAPVIANNTVAVAASTLLAAALFQPLRRRVQLAVDRRFNRSRVDADRAAAAFAAHVRSEVDLARLRIALVATSAGAVQPLMAEIWLRAESETH